MKATMSPENQKLLKETICSEVTDDDFGLFVKSCENTGLDPFARQIYPVTRWNKNEKRNVTRAEATIDGFRVVAERNGNYAGQLGPFWCGQNGEWVDVWLAKEPPAAAKVGVMRSDFKEPLWAVATWAQYVQTTRDGKVGGMWAKMGPLMLAKCAEALALRRAFPNDLSGVYTREEMAQAEKAEPPAEQEPQNKPEESPQSAVEAALSQSTNEPEPDETQLESQQQEASKGQGDVKTSYIPTKKELVEKLVEQGLSNKMVISRCQSYFHHHCEGKEKFSELTDEQKAQIWDHVENGLLKKEPTEDYGFLPF